MYLIHISHVYGPATDYPANFVEYLQKDETYCARASTYQSRILDGFGLAWRYVAISSAEHGWIEVEIDGQWEIFDATANLWIDHSAFELLTGILCRYRLFYTPWSDEDLPEARASIADYAEQSSLFYYTPGTLRAHMPGLGIYFVYEAYRRQSGVQLEIWPDFSPPVSPAPHSR